MHCSNSYSLICVDLKVNLVKIYMYVYLLTENSTGNHHDIFLHYESFYFWNTFWNYAPVLTNKTGVTITKSYKFFLKVFYMPDSSCLLKLFLCVQRVYEAILLLSVKHVNSNSDISLLRQPGEEKKEKKEKKEKRVKKKREEDEGGEWEEVTKGAPMIKVINIYLWASFLYSK